MYKGVAGGARGELRDRRGEGVGGGAGAKLGTVQVGHDHLERNGINVAQGLSHFMRSHRHLG